MDRLYTSREMARLYSPRCEGCGECCRGMGDTILLDPYDSDLLSKGLTRPFAALLHSEVELTADNGLIIPYLAMNERTGACSFLEDSGRCGIHSFRPGICRLYPLARKYSSDGIRYFFPENGCREKSLSKIRIDKWIGYGNTDLYERFKADWFSLCSLVRQYLKNAGDIGQEREMCMFVLENFYIKGYGEDAFFEEYPVRAERLRKMLKHAG